MTHDAYVTIGWDECLYVRCEVCGTVFGPTDDEFLANRTAIDHEKNSSLSTPPPAVHVCMVTAIYEDGGRGNRGLFRVWCENCLATSPGTYDREEAERLDEAHRIDPVAHPITKPVDGIPLDRLSQDRPFNDRPQPAKGVAVEHSDMRLDLRFGVRTLVVHVLPRFWRARANAILASLASPTGCLPHDRFSNPATAPPRIRSQS